MNKKQEVDYEFITVNELRELTETPYKELENKALDVTAEKMKEEWNDGYKKGYNAGKEEDIHNKIILATELVDRERQQAITQERERLKKWAEKNKHYAGGKLGAVVDFTDLFLELNK